MLDNELENRNCDCNNMNQVVSDISDNNNCNSCEQKENIRRKMMMQIRELEFAINELALYLDTHPDDQKALCLHRKYCNELRPLKDQYQKVYGPLDICFPRNKWRWLEEPWPWERGNF